MTDNQETKLTKKNSVIIDDDKNTRLHYSAAHGKEDEVLQDLETEQVNVANYLGWTPLMMACRNGHLKTVDLLLQHRADATRENKFGVSVFLASVASGNLEVVHMILQHLLCGGVSRQRMQYFLSPISLSVLFCHQQIVKYLIEQGFSLNMATFHTGITPLMFACAMDNCEAFTLLLSKGADPTIKNYLGFTSHDIQFRDRKVNANVIEVNQQPSPTAMVTNSSQLQTQQQFPYVVFSPQPTFIQLSTNPMVNHHIRKSSNTLSPSPNYLFASPNITPIPQINYMPPPQVFFPPEFSPSQFYASPIPNVYNNSNDFLNVTMNQNAMYLSPLPPTISFTSPCM